MQHARSVVSLLGRTNASRSARSVNSTLFRTNLAVGSHHPRSEYHRTTTAPPKEERKQFFEVKAQRNSSFAKLTQDDILHFKSILGHTGVITEPSEVEAYNVDWMRQYRGNSGLVLRPKTTQQVSDILKYCNSRKLAVVPQGGNTGLVGGSVPVFDEIILSMSLMNNIISFDKVSGVLVCQAGCILEKLDSYLEQHGYIMPLDLGAKGSCQIGGNVATNAGGIRLLRYGSLHSTVTGVEVVMADGTIVNALNTLKKDNTGYHLEKLFIGSEGTLGVITAVAIQVPHRPKAVNVSLVGLKSFEAVQKACIKAKTELGEIVSAIEFFDQASLALVLSKNTGVREPLSERFPFYMVIETSGSNNVHDEEKLRMFLEGAMEDEIICDGTIAQDQTQAKGIWKLREGITEALARTGAVYKYDVSLPVPQMYKLVEEMNQRLTPFAKDGVQAVGYGHIGDGNMHLNISVPSGLNDEVFKQIEPFVYEWTAKHNGSISAEHGLGVMKATKIGYSKTPEMIEIMRRTKAMMDPNGILNPYKVLPPASPQSQ